MNSEQPKYYSIKRNRDTVSYDIVVLTYYIIDYRICFRIIVFRKITQRNRVPSNDNTNYTNKYIEVSVQAPGRSTMGSSSARNNYFCDNCSEFGCNFVFVDCGYKVISEVFHIGKIVYTQVKL